MARRPTASAAEVPEFQFEYRHELQLRGFILDPDQVTKRLGLRPTTIRRRGDPLPFGKNLIVKQNFWKHAVQWKGDTLGVNAERHLRSLKRLVKLAFERKREIARIIPPGECCIYSIAYCDSPNCIVQLPPRVDGTTGEDADTLVLQCLVCQSDRRRALTLHLKRGPSVWRRSDRE